MLMLVILQKNNQENSIGQEITRALSFTIALGRASALAGMMMGGAEMFPTGTLSKMR